MEGPEGSPPQSLCMIRAAELFPKQQMEKEDTQLTIPFQELAGESVKYLGRTDDGVLALSNYRIFLLKSSTNSETSVPLGLIETAQSRDLFHLIINCKDASTVKCSFETAEQCSEWQRRIQISCGVPEALESLFAFPFCSWTCDRLSSNGVGGSANHNGTYSSLDNPLSSTCSSFDYAERLQRASRYEDDFIREVERLGFDLNGSWRISHANQDFKLCASYPQKFLVPCCISDEKLHEVANFRGSRRLPAVVWRHRRSGAVIARCSQPEVGWLGWRNDKDEQLLKALADACAFDRGEQSRRMAQVNHAPMTTPTVAPPSGESSPSSADGSHEEIAMDEVRKILIVDARSYTSAVTNRARGGGCECIEYYPCAEIEFMSLGNIHAIRKSFHALRQLCASPPDNPSWLGLLEKTMWLQHLSGLLAASVTVCHAIEKKGRPVLVHCSDGWDRTPQIVATAQLCLDPFYRTVEGFRILVEREWLSYGHKFADRCGHGPGAGELNERCPVFLQWLDLVHQIHKQFPCSFEFSMGYLIKLAQHSHSCLFGTFLCNTLRERIENSVFERTFSVWPFLSGPIYRNPLYVPHREKVLWPAHNVRDLSLWTEVYLGSLGNQNAIDHPACHNDGLHTSMTQMAKTRSYGDLLTAGVIQNGISRRSSDPNMTVDPNLTMGSSSENNSIADIQSEREDSPDILANLIHDTTQKLQNLTIELNSHDEDDFRGRPLAKPIETEESCFDGEVEEGLRKLLQQQLQPPTTANGLTTTVEAPTTAEETTGKEATVTTTNGGALFSSPQETHNLREVGCESLKNPVDYDATTPIHRTMTNACNGINSNHSHCSEMLTEKDDCDKEVGRGGSEDDDAKCVEEVIAGITIRKAENMDVNLMQSMDLGDASFNALRPCSATETHASGMWYGSVNTSTDTLVPMEGRHLYSSPSAEEPTQTNGDSAPGADAIDGGATVEFSRETRTAAPSILPEVHAPKVAPPLPAQKAPLSVTPSNSIYSENTNNITYHQWHPTTPPAQPPTMDESILIFPEHQKLEILSSGRCEAYTSAATTTAAAAPPTNTTTTATPTSFYGFPAYGPPLGATTTTQRRRCASSSNSRRDAFLNKHATNGSLPRFSIPGVRSLPMTPPGLIERPQIAISCPDGLAHALSEQNIRLQQIVYEHKLREDVLLREIHDMRVALLKKICPNCNGSGAPTAAAHDEQSGVLENGENASICSWEAVEDRSGPPSSCTSSSTQPNNAASVLWVPDHAVSRCTSCQTEFWLGRRKHHCRSCGQIFCADCSEFWAPLPDEKLFSPVRLCGPCYHSVTTRMQVTQFQNSALLQLHQSAAKAAAAAAAANAVPTPTPQAAATSKA